MYSISNIEKYANWSYMLTANIPISVPILELITAPAVRKRNLTLTFLTFLNEDLASVMYSMYANTYITSQLSKFNGFLR